MELSGLNVVSTEKPKSSIMYLYCEDSSNNCNSTDGDYIEDNYYSVTNDGIGWMVNLPQKVHSENTALADQSATKNGFIITVFTEPKKAQRNMQLKRGRNAFYYVMYDDFKVEPAVPGHGASVFPLSNVGNTNWSNTSDINTYCSAATTGMVSGFSCAAKIVRAGMKMEY